MDAENNARENHLGFLNLLLIVLSIYVLVALFLDTVYKLPPEISRLLYYTDHAICVVFFFDFCLHFYHAESKLRFMRWGWIDLISSVPAIGYLRAGRTFRLIRLLRVLRAFRSTSELMQHIFRNRAHGAFTMVSITTILLVIFSSIAILQVENAPDSNIKTAEDAIWWAYCTVISTSYGDKYPVTTEGRVIAGILMTGGLGLMGTFTAYVASWFISGNKDDTIDAKKQE